MDFAAGQSSGRAEMIFFSQKFGRIDSFARSVRRVREEISRSRRAGHVIAMISRCDQYVEACSVPQSLERWGPHGRAGNEDMTDT